MISVGSVGMSGFAFPECIVQLWHKRKMESFSFRVDFAVVYRVRDLGRLLDGVPYCDRVFSLAVYRDGGLLIPEALYENIRYILGFFMGGVSMDRYHDDGLSYVLSSVWHEFISTGGARSGLVVRFRSRLLMYECDLSVMLIDSSVFHSRLRGFDGLAFRACMLSRGVC